MRIVLYCLGFCFFFGKDYSSPKRVYDIEHGIIYFTASGMASIAGNGVIYFDHFGNRQLIKVETTPEITTRILQIDSIQYSWFDTKQCIKSGRKKKFGVANVNLNAIDSNAVKEFGIVSAGNVEYLNRVCNKYTILNKNQHLTGEIMEWKKIPLSIHFMNNGRLQENKVYKIDTLSKLPNNIFELPQGIQIIDATSMDNN
jgi:hypothetical protein